MVRGAAVPGAADCAVLPAPALPDAVGGLEALGVFGAFAVFVENLPALFHHDVFYTFYYFFLLLYLNLILTLTPVLFLFSVFCHTKLYF